MNKNRRLFCQLSPVTYRISVVKCCIIRFLYDLLFRVRFAKVRQRVLLPVAIYKHNSLIRRTLGNVDSVLQENKAVNLSIAAPNVSHVIIRPGETFSFWHLVGRCTAKNGYLEGLTIKNGVVDCGVGGGLCQLTNLIHWIVLHSPLTVVEHHHDGKDLFPDFGRQVSFGLGTSIFYNYVDYRFRNDTKFTFQFVVFVTDERLCGELRSDGELPLKYHINAEDQTFVQEGNDIYRTGKIYRRIIDKRTGNTLSCDLIKENHACVMYNLDVNTEIVRN